jgi:hypothetical protein
MGSSWSKVSVAAIALAALGCCPDQDANKQGQPLHCDLSPTPGTILTVKGTAQYMTSVSGDGVVEGISYSDGQNLVFVADPKQPFSVTVELEVGDLYQSSSYGHTTLGSISAIDSFTPVDDSAVIDNSQSCWTGLPHQI